MTRHLGVIAPESPNVGVYGLSRFFKAELEDDGFSAEDLNHETSLVFDEALSVLDGLVVATLNLRNHAGWDYFVVNGVRSAARNEVPVFSQWALEDIEYYAFSRGLSQPIEVVDSHSKTDLGMGQIPASTEIVVFGNDIDVIRNRLG